MNHPPGGPPPAPYRGPVLLVSATAGLVAAAVGASLPGALGYALTSWDAVPLFTWNLYVAGYGAWAFLLGALDARATLLGRTRWIGALAIPLFSAITLALGVRSTFLGTPVGQGTIFVLAAGFVVSLVVAAATVGAGIGLVAVARAVTRDLAKADPAVNLRTRSASFLVLGALGNLVLCSPTTSFAVAVVVAGAGAALGWRTRARQTLLAAGGIVVAASALIAQGGAAWAEYRRVTRSELPASPPPSPRPGE